MAALAVTPAAAVEAEGAQVEEEKKVHEQNGK